MSARDITIRPGCSRENARALPHVIALSLFVAGCKETPPPVGRSTGVTVRPAFAPSAGRFRRDVADFVDQQLALRGSQLPSAMIPAAAAARGTLATGAVASHDFDVAAGHCYRVVAVGGVEVNDLDLTLFGPDGSELDSDRHGETYPVLGSVRPICPPTSGHYRVEVRMASGQGEYGLQVFATP